MDKIKKIFIHFYDFNYGSFKVSGEYTFDYDEKEIQPIGNIDFSCQIENKGIITIKLTYLELAILSDAYNKIIEFKESKENMKKFIILPK